MWNFRQVLIFVLLSSCCFGLRADITGDGRVDYEDLAILSSEWLTVSYSDTILLNGELYGRVGTLDKWQRSYTDAEHTASGSKTIEWNGTDRWRLIELASVMGMPDETINYQRINASPIGAYTLIPGDTPAYLAETTYSRYAQVIASDGGRYTSLVNGNLNHNPISSPSYWRLDNAGSITATEVSTAYPERISISGCSTTAGCNGNYIRTTPVASAWSPNPFGYAKQVRTSPVGAVVAGLISAVNGEYFVNYGGIPAYKKTDILSPVGSYSDLGGSDTPTAAEVAFAELTPEIIAVTELSGGTVRVSASGSVTDIPAVYYRKYGQTAWTLGQIGSGFGNYTTVSGLEPFEHYQFYVAARRDGIEVAASSISDYVFMAQSAEQIVWDRWILGNEWSSYEQTYLSWANSDMSNENAVRQTIAFEAGKTYHLNYQIAYLDEGATLSITAPGLTPIEKTQTGNYTATFIASGSGEIVFACSGSGEVYVDLTDLDLYWIESDPWLIPSIMSLTDNGGGQVTVDITGVGSITLYYRLSGAAGWTTGGSRSGSGDIVISGLTLGRTYEFYAVAETGGVYSVPSSISTTTLFMVDLTVWEWKAQNYNSLSIWQRAALDLLAIFGQAIIYQPVTGTPRSIFGIIDFDGVGKLESTSKGYGPQMKVSVFNHAVYGITSEEVNTGGDLIVLPTKKNGSAQPRRITKVTVQDEGMIVFEVR